MNYLIIPYLQDFNIAINSICFNRDIKNIERCILTKKLSDSLTEDIFVNSDSKIFFILFMFLYNNSEASNVHIELIDSIGNLIYDNLGSTGSIKILTYPFEFSKIIFSAGFVNSLSNLYINYLKLTLN